MKDRRSPPHETDPPRVRPERALRKTTREIQTMPAQDVHELLDELQARQEDLKVQIEELRNVQLALKESRDAYQGLYDTSLVGDITLDREGMVQQANLTAAALLGVERHHLVGSSLANFVAPDDQGRLNTMLHRAFEAPGRRICEVQMIHSNKPSFRARLEGAPVLDSQGAVSRLRVAVVDVSDPQQAERGRGQDCLAHAQVEWERTFDTVPDLIAILDDDFRIVRVNQAMADALGVSREQVVGKTCYECVHGADKPQSFCPHAQTMADGQEHMVEVLEERLGGHFLVSTSPLRDSRGHPVGSVHVARDITQRKQTEEALRASEERYRLLLEHSGLGIGYYALDGTILMLNRKACEYLQGTLSDFVGKSVLDVFGSKVGQVIIDRISSAADSGETHEHEDLVDLPSGKRWFLSHYSPIADAAGHTVGVQIISADINERKEAEEALRESQARLKQIADTVEDVFWITDWSSKGTLFASRAYEKVWGRSRRDLYDNPGDWADAIHSEDRRRAWEAFLRLDQRGTYDEEYRIIRPDGSIRWIRDRGFPVRDESGKVCRVIGIAQDITEQRQAEEERRKLEAQVQHAQKLESLGVLAGGIAHDFNNLLTAILGNAFLAQTELPEESPAQEYIKAIQQVGQRAAELTGQMLAYSGRGKFVVRAVDLSSLTEDLIGLLKSSISKTAALTPHLVKGLPAVEGDASQLQQVVMNLVLNASDAIGEKTGVINVSTGVMEVDGSELSRNYIAEGATSGTYVYLEVADNGCGMDAETKARIFDPFFTSKQTGRGLGLAALLGIVRGHRGAVRVDSEPGKGTTFRVLLPATDRPKEDIALEADPSESWRGSGTVLVIDDEAPALDTARRLLAKTGLTVLTAENGRRGVEVFREHAEAISAVLLDVTMPEMGGEEAFREIRRIRPDACVVLASGYTKEDVASRLSIEGVAGFIQKPYHAALLFEKIRAAIEG